MGNLPCSDNELQELISDFNNISLETISFSNNKISLIDISQNRKLDILSCANNKLSALDTRKQFDIRYLDCSNNQTKTICVGNIEKATVNSKISRWNGSANGVTSYYWKIDKRCYFFML